MVSEDRKKCLKSSPAMASAAHKMCMVFQSDAFGGQSLFGYRSSVTLKTRELFSFIISVCTISHLRWYSSCNPESLRQFHPLKEQKARVISKGLPFLLPTQAPWRIQTPRGWLRLWALLWAWERTSLSHVGSDAPLCWLISHEFLLSS